MKTEETPLSIYDLIKEVEKLIRRDLKESQGKAKDYAKKGKYDHAASYTAEADGRDRALGIFEGAKPDISKEAALIHLCGYLISGADDKWSGRGNDLKREIHDAYLQSAHRFLKAFRYGYCCDF